MRWILLLLYMSSSVALAIYLLKHPLLFKKGAEAAPTAFVSIVWRVWGPSLWLFPGWLWIAMPLLSAAWKSLPLPVAFLLVGISVGVPFLVFLAVLIWSDVAPRGPLMMLACLDVLFLLLLAGGLLLAWRPGVWRLLLPFLKFPAQPEVAAMARAFWKQLPAFLMLILTAPLLSVLLLLGWSPDLIPTHHEEADRQRKALTLLLGFFSGCPKPSSVVHKNKTRLRLAGDAEEGAGPGWLLTEPENVAVLKGRSEIRRVVGPGAAFTHRDEVIHSIMDLRPQVRAIPIQAMTRDGIKVATTLTVVFQITPGRRAIHLLQPWPYARDAVWRIIFAAEVNPSGRTPLEAHQSHPWSDLPLAVARNVLPQVLIEYALDDLYDVQPEQIPPRQEIGARVRQHLTEQLTPLGFYIESCGVGILVPVEAEVTRQRIEAWKSRWIRQLMTWQGAAQARRFAHFAAIRNQARVDLLSHLIEATNATLQQGGGDAKRNLVAYHLLESLEHIARSPEIQSFLPDSAIPALTDLRERLKDTAL